MSSLLFPVLKLSRENTQPVNLYVWHHFWKRERWEAAVQRVLYNECFWEISQNSQQSISVGIFFLIKLNSVDLQLHEKRDSSAGVFLWILQIRKNTFFSKHHQTDGSNCSSISSISNEGRIGKQNCKLWSKNHVPIWARRVTYWEGYSRWKNRFQDFSF